jgi:nucleotide-binding universal stress UspA family protein
MALTAKNVLVAYDGSDGARLALDAAADLVGYGSTLTVVAVAGGRARNGEAPVDTVSDTRPVLEDARRRLARRHVDARTIAATGEPVSTLVEEAERRGSDLLVVSGRRRLSGGSPRLGSVSAGVVLHAGCDVLVVRPNGNRSAAR